MNYKVSWKEHPASCPTVAMATSSLVIHSKAQKQQARPSWPNNPQSITPWLQTTQIFPKLSPGEDNHSSRTCQVPRLVAECQISVGIAQLQIWGSV